MFSGWGLSDRDADEVGGDQRGRETEAQGWSVLAWAGPGELDISQVRSEGWAAPSQEAGPGELQAQGGMLMLLVIIEIFPQEVPGEPR